MASGLALRTACLLVLALWSSPAWATTMTFTDPVAFLAGLPGSPSVLDFEGAPAGTSIPSGSALSGITFTYSIDGLSLKITNAFDTTSATNSLGLTGGDEALLDGDEVAFGFASPILALGLFVIASDPALAGEIQIVVAGDAALNSGSPYGTLADGGLVYFLGLISDTPFSSGLLTFASDGEVNFAYNLDDLTTVPEPGLPDLLLLGLAWAGSRWRGSWEAVNTCR